MKIFAALLVGAFLLAACGEEKSVGSEVGQVAGKKGGSSIRDESEAINKKKQGGGFIDEETPPPATTAPTAAPTPPPTFYDVALVANSPYYSVNGEPLNQLVMSIRATLRVTNKDETRERNCRSFTHAVESGSPLFSTGCMPPNAAPWSHIFEKAGKFPVRDDGLTFASTSITVR